jgi:hypothetical protein
MTWQLWIVVGVFAFGGLSTILSVGKERTPTSPELGAAVVVFDILLIALILWSVQ